MAGLKEYHGTEADLETSSSQGTLDRSRLMRCCTQPNCSCDGARREQKWLEG